MISRGRFALAALLPVLLLAGCSAVPSRDAAAPERSYVFKQVGSGWFALPSDYRIGGDPAVSPYPDDEVCFDGVYTDLWKQYSLAPLIELREWLARRDIGLVLMLYPDPWEIAARVGQPAGTYPAGCAERAARELTSAGFNVVDTTPAILATAADYPMSFYYDRLNDLHPDTGAVEPAAEALKTALAPWRIAPAPDQKFTLETVPTPAGRYHPETGARLTVTHVLLNGKTPPLRSPGAPVLVVGNSISATPYAGESAARLGRQLGVMPDYLRCDGDGIALGAPRRLVMGEKDYLAGKKVVVLVLSYPQLFYRWQRIGWVENLIRSAVFPERTMPAAEWPRRLVSVAAPDDGWWCELSRLLRSADRYRDVEEEFMASKERLYGPMAFFKSTSAGWHTRFGLGTPPPGAIWKLTVVTTAPPGYLHLRAGDYETTLNDYEETLYLPAAEALEITADLPEQVVGLGDLTVYASGAR